MEVRLCFGMIVWMAFLLSLQSDEALDFAETLELTLAVTSVVVCVDVVASSPSPTHPASTTAEHTPKDHHDVFVSMASLYLIC